MPKKKYSWRSPTFMFFEKSPSWYTTIALIGLAIALFFIFFLKRYLAAAVTVLSVIVLFRLANFKPKNQEIVVDDSGITVGNKLYDWEKLLGFWFVPTNDGLFLYLKTNQRLLPNVAIPIENKNPEEIRQTLLSYLPELPSRGEEMVDRVSRLLKF